MCVPAGTGRAMASNSTAKERSPSGERAVTGNGMKMSVDIGVPDAREMWLGQFQGMRTCWDRLK